MKESTTLPRDAGQREAGDAIKWRQEQKEAAEKASERLRETSDSDESSKWQELVEEGLSIGPFEFSIQESGGLSNFGEVSWAMVQITLRENLAPQAKAQCLLHEIVHILLEQSGRAKLSKDEELVDSFAYGLYQAIRDNPTLIAYLNEPGGDQ